MTSAAASETKVLFVSPPPWRRVKEPTLGIGYVAAVARSAGYDVHGCEMNAESLSLDDLGRRVGDLDPDVVAVTSLTANVKNAFAVGRVAKAAAKEAVVVLGGPHGTFASQSVLAEEPSVDLVLLGEGERSFVDFLKVSGHRSRWPEVRGIAFRTPEGIGSTGTSVPEMDLDGIPYPDREVLRYDLYIPKFGYAPMITSRGCSFSCRFCDVPVMMGRKMRYRSVENVIAEVEDLRSRGCRNVNFRDDVFTIHRRRTEELVGELQPLGISWGCETRVDLVDRELLSAMRAAGLSEIRFGAESLNQAALDVVNKGITPDETRRAVEAALAVGVEKVRVSFILGIPGETLEDMVRTIELAEALHPAECRFWPLTPLPGTPFGEDGGVFGLHPVSRDWDQYNAITPVTETPSLSLDELKRALDIAWNRHGHPLPDAIS